MKLQKNDYYILKKADLVMIAAVLVVAGIAALFLLKQNEGNEVVVISDGKSRTYPLNNDNEIKVKSPNGGYNVVVISDGKVYVREADCKNQICVNHKPIYKDHETIVCVPNKLTVEMHSNINNEIDN